MPKIYPTFIQNNSLDNSKIKIEESWKKILHEEFQKPYFQEIISFLKTEKAKGINIYPPGPNIFQAFNSTPWDDVKLIIIGQDPYHNPGQAMGLSFSVPRGIKLPPSLKNIFREIKTDVGIELPDHGDLSSWAEQGVFLLNAMLTVEHKKAGSHKKIGWQSFTDRVIQILSEQKEGLVFLLWGNFAKNKKELIDGSKHLILEAAHPSPLARGAFFGSKHFSQSNEYLISKNKKPIDWQT